MDVLYMYIYVDEDYIAKVHVKEAKKHTHKWSPLRFSAEEKSEENDKKGKEQTYKIWAIVKPKRAKETERKREALTVSCLPLQAFCFNFC